MRIRIEVRKKVDITVACGQQANKSDKHDFYEQLQTMIDKTPIMNSLIVAGTMSAKAMEPSTDVESKIINFIGDRTIYHRGNVKRHGTENNRE